MWSTVWVLPSPVGDALDAAWNQYTAAIAVPLAFIAVTALARKAIRGEKAKWIASDGYFGLDLVIASLSGQAAFASQGLAEGRTEEFGALSGFSVLALVAIIYWHLCWDRRSDRRTRKYIMLHGCSNVVGFAVLSGFVLVAG